MKTKLNLKLAIVIVFVFAASTSFAFAVEVSIPELTADSSEIIEIPVNVGKVEGIFSIELTLEYDAEIIIIGPVKSTDLTKNFLKATSVVSPGKLLISLASPRPFNGQGTIVNIKAKVRDKVSSGQFSPLNLTRAILNEGAVKVTVKNGKLIVGKGVSVDKQEVRFSSWGKIKIGF
jgi:hypothetical protein